MKIAHIVCTYPPYTGGMGNVAFEMASGLSELGHEVEVFTPYFSDFDFKEQKDKTQDFARRLKTPFKYGNAAYLPDLKKELNKFDIVHLHYPFFGSAGIIKNWKLKNPERPLFITYHMDNRGDGLKGLIFKLNAKWGLSRVLKVADKIQATSFDYLKNSDAAKIFEKDPEKFFELPLGVDTDRFQPRQLSEEALTNIGLDPNKPTVLFVGGMDEAHYFKGIPVLLKSLLILKKNNFDLQTIFVGDGNLREDYEIKTKAFGLSDNVRFIGSVTNEDLPFYYNLADLLVLPSINQGEAFGLVLLEAMASEVPIIASDTPGVRSVASDGGLLVKPGDYKDLAKKIFDYFGENREELKKQVREVVEEKYSWKKIIKKLEEEYLKIL